MKSQISKYELMEKLDTHVLHNLESLYNHTVAMVADAIMYINLYIRTYSMYIDT